MCIITIGAAAAGDDTQESAETLTIENVNGTSASPEVTVAGTGDDNSFDVSHEENLADENGIKASKGEVLSASDENDVLGADVSLSIVNGKSTYSTSDSVTLKMGTFSMASSSDTVTIYLNNKQGVNIMSSLVIYFSRSGENYFGGELKNIEKGNTEVIAEYIQELDGADLFKVEPAAEYPASYMECIDVAKKEQQSDARPEIKETLESIDQYDTIYIGFPNWWGTLPMPMFTQLEQLDFAGKVVKPFVTHEGSGFGSSQKDLAKLCEEAEIKRGLSIPGANVAGAKDTVKAWIDE